LGAVVGVGFAALGLAIGARQLADNSFFTHLATGRLIVDSGHIPRSDPYTFTAHGASWVVQSWLPSTVYALLEDLAGLGAVRLFMGGLTAAMGALVWRLTRPTQGLLVRLAIGILVLTIGASQWASRPLLVGLLALLATMLAVEGGLSARWLLPIGWLWVNSHGSFPLGVVYVLAVLVGCRLDGTPSGPERASLRYLVGGIALGLVNPLGPRLLLFPVELLQRQDVLRFVREWQSPDFQSLGQRLFLLQMILTILALVRRPSYRSAIPTAIFLAAALLGSRNIAVASLVFVPVLAGAWTDVGALRADARPRIARAGLVATSGLLAVVALGAIGGPHVDLDRYPVASLDFLDEHHVDLGSVRLGGPERVGNLLELRDGATGDVFFDDRFDMFPDAVNHDMSTLLAGRPGVEGIVDRWDLDLLLWPRTAPTAQILDGQDGWRRLRRDGDWVLLCRVGVELAADLRC
jgi:hypothetical protein